MAFVVLFKQMKPILPKVKAYFELLLLYQKRLNQDLVMTYDRGYWWCTSDQTLNKFEKEFLKVGLETDLIIKELKTCIDDKDKTFFIHLLGWASDKSRSGEILVEYVESENSDYANASLRALFPMVVAEVYKISPAIIQKLLYSKSLVVKNKILGLLAFMPETDILHNLSDDDIFYIKKLVKHKNKPLIALPAKMVVDRL